MKLLLNKYETIIIEKIKKKIILNTYEYKHKLNGIFKIMKLEYSF